MIWFLLITLAVVVVLAIFVIFALAAAVALDSEKLEQARIEAEVRFAEHRLHDIARDGFMAMLEEARSGNSGRVL